MRTSKRMRVMYLRYILDKPYVCVEGHPSKKLAKSMVVEEKKRIEAQVRDLHVHLLRVS